MRNFALLIASLIFIFILTEVALKVSDKYFPFSNISVRIKNISFEDYIIRKPKQSILHRSNKNYHKINYNEIGFRDDSWKANTDKIAILGDSYLEALGVNDSNIVSFLLQDLTNKDVINISREKFNTVDEYYYFKKFGLSLKPELVILFCYLDNDIMFNANSYDLMLNKNTKPIDYIIHNEVYSLPKSQINTSLKTRIKNFVRKNSIIIPYLYYSVLKIKYILKNKISINSSSPSSSKISIKIKNKNWEATKSILIKLNEMVKSYNGELVIISFQSLANIQLDKNQDNLNSLESRIKDITDENNIHHYPLNNFLSFYFKDKKEPKECLSLDDGHWNELTHHVVTYNVLEFLESKGLVNINNKSSLINNYNNYLNMDPVEIIGKRNYKNLFQ